MYGAGVVAGGMSRRGSAESPPPTLGAWTVLLRPCRGQALERLEAATHVISTVPPDEEEVIEDPVGQGRVAGGVVAGRCCCAGVVGGCTAPCMLTWAERARGSSAAPA